MSFCGNFIMAHGEFEIFSKAYIMLWSSWFISCDTFKLTMPGLMLEKTEQFAEMSYPPSGNPSYYKTEMSAIAAQTGLTVWAVRFQNQNKIHRFRHRHLTQTMLIPSSITCQHKGNKAKALWRIYALLMCHREGYGCRLYNFMPQAERVKGNGLSFLWNLS